MYKKRFKKWNIRKRPYRRADAEAFTSTPTETLASPNEQTSGPLVRRQDALALIAPSQPPEYAALENVLASVFSWSASKLDTVTFVSDPMSKYLQQPDLPPIQDSRTMYRTFELVFDLWHRGQGTLAGLAAQRAFYILEFVLSEDHPDVIWHVLDTVYDMVDWGHLQLLGLFLNYAPALAQQKLPAGHPLLQILQQLKACDYQTQQGREYVCHLLRQAWIRNADLLEEHIGMVAPRHLWLYEQLIWDGRTRLRKNSVFARRREIMGPALGALRAAYNSAAIMEEADRLRVEALMLEFTQMEIGDKAAAEGLAVSLLERTNHGSSRSSARFQAYGRKMLARLQEDRQEWEPAEQNLRCAVDKRVDAHGTSNDLRVIRDMWVLEGYMRKLGKIDVADAITRDAISRARILLQKPPERIEGSGS